MIKQNNGLEQVKYPDFETITKLTKNTIKENFKKYGNSWGAMPYTGLVQSKKEWWEKRLINEVKELEKCKDDAERRNELLDVIAVASFMLDTLHKHGDFIWNDKWWRYP